MNFPPLQIQILKFADISKFSMYLWKLLNNVISTSADSQPTKLRGLLVFLLLFFLLGRGDGSLSLEGGKSSSWCLIITVITFCIMGVPVYVSER